TDLCGNTSYVTQTITVTDNTFPVAMAPNTIDIECSNVVPAGVTTIGAYLALGGTASDNCTPQGSLTVGYTDGSLVGTNCNGSIARTYRITDLCGNTTFVTQTITVTDNTKPTASHPAPVNVQCIGNIPAQDV